MVEGGWRPEGASGEPGQAREPVEGGHSPSAAAPDVCRRLGAALLLRARRGFLARRLLCRLHCELPARALLEWRPQEQAHEGPVQENGPDLQECQGQIRPRLLVHEPECSLYFIECLLYQAQTHCLRSRSKQGSSISAPGWATTCANRQRAAGTARNEITGLFGTGSDQWRVAKARRFVDAMTELWKDYASASLLDCAGWPHQCHCRCRVGQPRRLLPRAHGYPGTRGSSMVVSAPSVWASIGFVIVLAGSLSLACSAGARALPNLHSGSFWRLGRRS